MAITDRGLPTTDHRTAIADLIESNMAAVGGWTPVVNTGWLEFKKQKTNQIALQPLLGETESSFMGLSSQMAKTSIFYYGITLFAPNRSTLWTMMTNFIALMNDGTLTAPAAGISGGYHYIKIAESDDTKMVRMMEPNCGPGQGDENCIGYRTDYTVVIRWEE